jgi:hypothetical protein
MTGGIIYGIIPGGGIGSIPPLPELGMGGGIIIGCCCMQE